MGKFGGKAIFSPLLDLYIMRKGVAFPFEGMCFCLDWDQMQGRKSSSREAPNLVWIHF